MSKLEPQSSLKARRESILDECERLIKHFDKKADEAKRDFRIFKYSSVFLATSVAILSALQSANQLPALQIVIPIVSTIAALATTLLAVTNAQEHWLQARSTQQKFVVERILFLQEAGAYAALSGTERVQEFSMQVMSIWSSGHEQWEKSSKLAK